jgi:hypothetical protein
MPCAFSQYCHQQPLTASPTVRIRALLQPCIGKQNPTHAVTGNHDCCCEKPRLGIAVQPLLRNGLPACPLQNHPPTCSTAAGPRCGWSGGRPRLNATKSARLHSSAASTRQGRLLSSGRFRAVSVLGTYGRKPSSAREPCACSVLHFHSTASPMCQPTKHINIDNTRLRLNLLECTVLLPTVVATSEKALTLTCTERMASQSSNMGFPQPHQAQDTKYTPNHTHAHAPPHPQAHTPASTHTHVKLNPGRSMRVAYGSSLIRATSVSGS